MNRLKQKELKAFRTELWNYQGKVCPLCNLNIKLEDAVLDHSHKTGHVRSVLHRACNSSEGRVMKWAYSSKSRDPLDFLRLLIMYHKTDFTYQPFHPKHLTSDEKEIKRLTKKKKGLKRDVTRAKYQARIDAIYKRIKV